MSFSVDKLSSVTIQGRSSTKLVGGTKVLKKMSEKILGFEWLKAAQMALKFLFFSGKFFNVFRIFLVRRKNFCQLFSSYKGFFHKYSES